jgi:hypothetical protein
LPWDFISPRRDRGTEEEIGIGDFQVLTELVHRCAAMLSEAQDYVAPGKLHRSFAAKTAAQEDKFWRESGVCGIRRQRLHDLFEYFPAVLVALELVEAGAGGGEQYYIAWLRNSIRLADCVL